MYKKILPLREN